jgi:hypothetical protein
MAGDLTRVHARDRQVLAPVSLGGDFTCDCLAAAYLAGFGTIGQPCHQGGVTGRSLGGVDQLL